MLLVPAQASQVVVMCLTQGLSHRGHGDNLTGIHFIFNMAQVLIECHGTEHRVKHAGRESVVSLSIITAKNNFLINVSYKENINLV